MNTWWLRIRRLGSTIKLFWRCVIIKSVLHDILIVLISNIAKAHWWRYFGLFMFERTWVSLRNRFLRDLELISIHDRVMNLIALSLRYLLEQLIRLLFNFIVHLILEIDCDCRSWCIRDWGNLWKSFINWMLFVFHYVNLLFLLKLNITILKL